MSLTLLVVRNVAEYRAELRGHSRVLSALRETQWDHYAAHKADAAEIKAGLAQIVTLLGRLGGDAGAPREP